MAVLIFLDLETTGLDFQTDEIWMIHARAAFTGRYNHEGEFTALLGHNRSKMEKLPQKFRDVHAKFFPPGGGVKFPLPFVSFLNPRFAGSEFATWVQSVAGQEKAHFIAANPMFDATFIMRRMMKQDLFYKLFDYHLIDIEAMALGYLRRQELLGQSITGEPVRESFLPFKSDHLSKALGVYEADAHKHDAITDVDWLISMWKAMNNGKF